MIRAVAALLICQLIGELAARGLGLPVPGPVIGAALLFLWLLRHGGPDAELDRVADGLLANLSLLFVPAGTGVLLHAGRIGAEWPAIVAALLVSTLATLAVTGLVFRLLAGPEGEPVPGEPPE